MKYIEECKKKVKEYVVETIQRTIFENPQEIFKMLKADSSDCTGTSYVERMNSQLERPLQGHKKG